MAVSKTTNHNLNKPGRGDRDYDSLLNQNTDIIDTQLKVLADKDASLDSRITNIVVNASSSNTGIVDALPDVDGTPNLTLKARLDKMQTQLVQSERQTTTLSTGVAVANSEANTPAKVEVEGRTLVSLGNTSLEEGKKYVIADPKTRLVVDKKTVQGVGKFVKGTTKLTTATFEGKVSGSTVENPHKSLSATDSILREPKTFVVERPTDRYQRFYALDGSQYENQTTIVSGSFVQQLFSFNVIEAIERNIGRIPRTTVADKVAWLKVNANSIRINYHGFGSSPTGNKATLQVYNGTAWSLPTTHTTGTVSLLTRLINSTDLQSANNFIDVNGMIHYLAYAEPSDGTIASVINTDFVSLDVELNASADLIARPTITRVANFEGKASGSTVENPHSGKWATSSTLTNPITNSNENSQAFYTGINALGGTQGSTTTSTNGGIAQQLFSFDLIAEVERNLGKIPKTTVADKVAWLKANVAKLTANWHGFGSSVGGSGATIEVWAGAWYRQAISKHFSSTVSKLSPVPIPAPYIDSNGFVHFLAYAEPSDGTIASVINTDYIDLEIELKPDADFTNPRLPLYEVTDESYNKILVDWNADEVVRRFPSVEGVQHLQGVGVFAEGDNLLPPFTEWTLHANAKVVSPYELELNANGVDQRATFIIPKPIVGQTLYYDTKLSSGAKLEVVYYDSETFGNVIAGSLLDRTSPVTFTIPSGTKRVEIRVTNRNSVNGMYTFKNPMLTLGSVAKPFVPRNPSSVMADVKLGAIGTAKDTLYEQDGRWLLRKAVEKDVVLDGSLDWGTITLFGGFRRSNTLLVNPLVLNNTSLVTKYNGRQLNYSGSNTAPDSQYMHSSNNLYITIDNSESGWAEGYTPSNIDQKRYFNGWKYTDGTTWTSVTGNGQTATAQVALDTKPTDYTPYKLSYVLATPQTIDVTDKVEGALKVNGLTQVEVMSGVIRREKVVPTLKSNTSDEYRINNSFSATDKGKNFTKHKTTKLIAVYKNGRIDADWELFQNNDSGHANGNSWARIKLTYFDPTAEYTVTYIALDKHLLTANPTNVKLAYAQNIRGSISDINDGLQDNTTNISILNKLVYDLLVKAKAGL